MLGLGMDEADEDEDTRLEVGGVPFIADSAFLDKHGKAFTLSFNEKKEVVLDAV